ncbi:MAG: ATP-binding cassette domain-containing protein [Candidatus Lokiarchaeota archaeon]|nr:ATP-binding cassette domain-containing protein [Candidatus Lokiarchaeota archaeon]
MNKKNDVLIELKDLSKKFGDFYAVKNVNLEIKKGEILGFLGPNGAGKSTTMKMIARLLKPNSGEIWIKSNGTSTKLTSKTKDALLDNVGFLIENPAFYKGVSPRLILSYFAKLKGVPRNKVKKRVEDVVSLVGLDDWINKKFKTFSKGMRQKIGIVSAIVHDPEIVVLDEPLSGLDPRARKEIRDLILKLRKKGKTLFISSHLLYEISEIADRVAMISHGKIVACDKIENLEARAKKSMIHLELLEPPEKEIELFIEKLHSIVDHLTGLEKDKNFIRYRPESKIFQILFDGDPYKQYEIINRLLSNDIKVIEFSVPKANLLEDLYLELVLQSDEEQKIIGNQTDRKIAAKALKSQLGDKNE